MIRPKPPYQVIVDYLKEQVLTSYSPGDRIPSENELAKMFNVSRLTARKAIEKLVNERLLVRVQGIGTFVSDVSKYQENAPKYVGILIQNKFDERGWSLVAGIERTLEEFRLRAMMVDLDWTNPKQISKRIKSLLKQDVVGFIISPNDVLLNSKVFDDLMKTGFPMVFVDRSVEGLKVVTVESSNYQGGLLLGRHLRKNHDVHRAVFVTEEPLSLTSVRERYEGFKQGLKGQVEAVKLKEGLKSFEKVITMVKKDGIDAIFFCHDLLAVHGVTVLLREGLKIPEDIRIVGFDDREVAKYVYPTLTTIKQDFEALGEGAALMLVKLLKKENVPEREQVPVRLVVRGSCGCLKE